MNIYHVERTDGGGGYDTFSDFVVVAKDEHDARSTNPALWGNMEDITDDYDETYSDWVKYSKTKATLIGKAEPRFIAREVVCYSFHAG